MTAGLVEVELGRWDGLLDRLGCADVYLEAGYVATACLLDPGEPVFLHLAAGAGDAVFAGILREAPHGAYDVTTPYGYGAPVAVGADPPAADFWALYERWCAERGVVASFFRFHPLFENHRYAGPTVRLEQLGGTVSWRLAGDADLFAGMHRTHRGKVRKAERAGTAVSVHEAPDDLDELVSLYEDTMERVGATAFYLFPAAYWESLVSLLRRRLVRVDARIGGELVASALCLAGARWLHYHLSATSELGRSSGAANLVLLEAARWGRAQGLEEFHLGGGLGGSEDSLYAFKAHFSPGGRREMHVGKAVHDVARYLELSGEASLSLDGYFPAYRRERPGRE